MGQDEFYFSDNHNSKSEAYELLNAHLNFKIKDINFMIWGKNILDKSYAIRGFYFSNEPPDWDTKLYTQRGPPVSLGATASIYF
jgi:hypothetical protein